MWLILTVAFAAMAVRLVVVQAFQAPAYARLAAQQRQSAVEFPARRGAIFDRDGRPLAISVDLHTVYADPTLVRDAYRAARKLSPVLDQGISWLLERLRGTRPGSEFEYLARQVEPEVAQEVRSLNLPGVEIRSEPKRFYPNGRLASQVLGFVDIDGNGLNGVERQYEAILKGEPGHMIVEEDPVGRPLPQAESTYDAPRPGRSLFLTIDKNIQYRTELALAEGARAYNAEAGTAIVMNPRTGEILAMANFPDFDPNHFWRFSQDAYRNRAVTDAYEPGSNFKPVTASAALEENVVTPKTRFVVPDAFPYMDRVIHDSHYHPTEQMTVKRILVESSNVGTVKIGLRLGGATLQRYIREYGFGSPTGLDFPGETPGIVLPREQWSGTTIVNLPIGQGIATTAVQMASAFTTLANGGVWVEPKLLYGTMDSGGKLARASAPSTRRIVSERTAAQMTRIMTGVVAHGTGVEAQVPGYAVAGKTGTAQKPLPTGGYGRSYVASFAGYAPADRPAVLALVVFDDPSPIWGGYTAAPTFKTIMQFALAHLGVAPTGNAEAAARAMQEAAETSVTPARD